MAGYVQAAFCRELLTPLWDQCNHVRLYCQGNLGHRFISGQLQIQLGTDEFSQEAKVAVLNMPPVFSEMDDDAVSPCQFH
jgi:hypothetical protein